MNKNLYTNEEIKSWLADFVESGVVTIIERRNGGLDIDVKSKAFHEHTRDYSSIKGFLRRNGFSSFVGVHSRQNVDKPTHSDDFTKGYELPDKAFDEIVKNIIT